MNDKVIELGKILVNELDIENSVDTLAKWMANYIAGKMVLLPTLSGKKQEAAKKECYDTILKLWYNRSVLPNGISPYSRFERI